MHDDGPARWRDGATYGGKQMRRIVAAAANGHGKAFLAGLGIAGGMVLGLVVYIHEGDVRRMERLEGNVELLLVEQAKATTKIDALVEWTRERISLIERKLP